jgi:CubicO group peptidase (beta-lactamase class C family)
VIITSKRSILISIHWFVGLWCIPHTLHAQVRISFVDSLRSAHHIPEVAYAVVSSTEVLELQVLGTKQVDRTIVAEEIDRFRIGSNTKTITAFIGAQLVHEGKITWDKRFFDLFPEMEKSARTEYHDLTLRDLLSFRTQLYKYTYTDVEPRPEQLSGDEAEQRRQLAAWGFAHQQLNSADSINFSNLAYVAAGLMLERASGRSYQQLVDELGKRLDVHFAFGAPNNSDPFQPWGHDARLKPEPPGDNRKLSWLEVAGNINASLQDHAQFVQEFLRGLKGKSSLLSAPEFENLLFGRPRFAMGWYWGADEQGRRLAWHMGNPGTFLSVVYMHADEDLAYIIFTNVQSDEAAEGLLLLYDRLKAHYGH